MKYNSVRIVYKILVRKPERKK